MLYTLAKWMIILEFSFILSATLAVFFVKPAIERKNKHDKQCLQRIKNYLTTTYRLDNNLPKSWKKLSLLLPIVQELDLDKNEQAWHEKRTHFITSIVLPLARAAAISRNWTLRLYAAQAFAMLSENTDEPYIIKLVSDSVPLVRYSALTAGILLGSETAIDLIITQLASQTWRTQSLYLNKFVNAPIKTRQFIENILKKSSDIKIRITCYRILLKYPPVKSSWDIDKDIHSKTLDLKLSALQFLAHTNRAAAIPILINALNDTRWQVQTVALHSLGDLNALEALSKITNCLSNSNEWVALMAAETLYRLGEPGLKILKSENISHEPAAYNIVHHVLDIES